MVFLFQTITRQRLSRVARARIGRRSPVTIAGIIHIPAAGNFVIALNHYGGASVFDLLAWTMDAVRQDRPDTADRWLLIVGQRERKAPTRIARLVAWVIDLVFSRWSEHTARIRLGNEAVSIRALRDWRGGAARQPVLVFPEGRAALQLASVRPGAGRWLAALGAPVIPVGIWCKDGLPQMQIGAPINWTHRSELRDAQLGLAIADLLPPDLAPRWQSALRRWKQMGAAPGGPV